MQGWVVWKYKDEKDVVSDSEECTANIGDSVQH